MNKLNLQIKSKALEDMEKIADYIAKDNQKAALDLLKFFILHLITFVHFFIQGALKKTLPIKMFVFSKLNKIT